MTQLLARFRSAKGMAQALRNRAFAAALFSLVATLSATNATADDRDGGYRDNHGGSYGDRQGNSWRNEERLRCESSNGRYKLCQVAIRGNVRLLREHSRADCLEGRSWGWSEAGIWVDHGCRGEFSYTPRMAGGYGSGYADGRSRHDDDRGRHDDDRGRDGWRDERRDGGAWGSGGRGGRGELRCESNRGRTVFCPAPVRGNVVLAKQLSHAPCRYGDTWTFDRRGISVRDGCRAEFRFETRGW